MSDHAGRKPTAQRIVTSITDAATGGMVIDGAQRDEYLLGFAKLIDARVDENDKRLHAFAAHTDSTGYIWLPQGCLDWRDRAHEEHWSFERCFNALVTAAEQLPAPAARELEEMGGEAAWIEEMARHGWRVENATHNPLTGEGGVTFVREDPDGS